MAWSSLSLTRVLVLGLLTRCALADSDTKADSPQGGSADGLAYEQIEKVNIYTGNGTAPQSPPVEGWWESKICSGAFCVYTNQRIANGRGLVAVTRFEEFQKLERIEDHLNRGENKYLEDPIPLTTTEVPHKGPGLTATKSIRRGKPLLVASPILIVHKSLFDQVPKKSERTRLLEAAISYLPSHTLTLFNTQRTPRHPSVEAILHAHPFELDLGYATHKQTADDHSRHFANYPEAAAFQHDCRPNVATHMDASFALRATVARRVQPGEELTLSYIDPFLARDERAAWVKRHRGGEKGVEGGCPCQACSPPGGVKGEKAVEGEKRLKEIVALRAELRNHDSSKVDFGVIERFLKLYEEERLHVRLAEAYELAALNFNYLGDDKRAKKYAELAVQAGIVEGGVQSNDVVAMRVMAKDVKGHYSYRYTLKRRGQ
ncbi:hypothetical protein CHGG_03598 [Chaetomium globosum CBS 148.51]|uniref:SET domain-containing protein n=1 Tax=Chaetomium globosum (strain ATCC 6205 / CBS 148.51 / DSM 1962 / NBRC 6347 / NRRL 1970) TaxID=306901 RepID=Q2H856_CHAGB|nr:uncharacterized protein CHGG_03598 [Chaetomium globosum CBS 148.51]EAQ91663.1 hypothetical protein CHGG_03598 [Chaetomium globosum CBS 148.51]